MNEYLFDIYNRPNVVNLATNENTNLINYIFDFIVIGSGAGGAVLSKELAEQGAKVALIEEGAIPFPWETSAFRSLLKLYRDNGFTGTIGKPMIPIPLGRCVGGTTVINSGTCFRVPQKVLNLWESEFGLVDINNENFQDCFSKVEKEIHVEDADWNVMNKSSDFIRKIFTQKNLPCLPLRRNTHNCQGCGMCCYGCTSGAKKSMEISYIPKAIQAGLFLFYNARAKRILLSDGKTGKGVLVDVVHPTTHKVINKVEIKGEKIIVACGTMLSPLLLKRSGIAIDNPNLGACLLYTSPSPRDS
mgnify:FL=1